MYGGIGLDRHCEEGAGIAAAQVKAAEYAKNCATQNQCSRPTLLSRLEGEQDSLIRQQARIAEKIRLLRARPDLDDIIQDFNY